MTRLLKTPIIGRNVAAVDSSCSDIEAGLSKCDIRRVPPGFWASAGSAINNTAKRLAAANASSFRAISASIAALTRDGPPSAAFLFRAYAGLAPSRHVCNYDMADM